MTRVTAYLCCDGAKEALQWYERALGAVELSRQEEPDGRLGHAEFQVGETVLYLSDEWAEMNVRDPRALGGGSVSLVVHVPDVDAAFARAVEAGPASNGPCPAPATAALAGCTIHGDTAGPS